MSLRAQAETDLGALLEAPGDWGNPVAVIDSAGNTADLFGKTTDVGQAIDPQTGVVISGRHAACTLRITSMAVAGLVGLPIAVSDESLLPWRVTFAGPSTPSQQYAVVQTFPNFTVGYVVCICMPWEGP